jgi:phage-related protein
MSQDEDNQNQKTIDFEGKAALKALRSLPQEIQLSFMYQLERITYGKAPTIKIDHLTESVGLGAIELKLNGSPAFRCVYYNKAPGKVWVIHAFVKTTNKSDKKNLATAKARLKALKATLRKEELEAVKNKQEKDEG